MKKINKNIALANKKNKSNLNTFIIKSLICNIDQDIDL